MGNLVRVSGKKIEVRGFGFCTSLNPISGLVNPLIGFEPYQTKPVILSSVWLVSCKDIQKPQIKCVWFDNKLTNLQAESMIFPVQL